MSLAHDPANLTHKAEDIAVEERSIRQALRVAHNALSVQRKGGGIFRADGLALRTINISSVVDVCTNTCCCATTVVVVVATVRYSSSSNTCCRCYLGTYGAVFALPAKSTRLTLHITRGKGEII